MSPTARSVEDLTLEIKQETHVKASLEVTFAALLEQLGSGMDTPEGTNLAMKLEAWPGGRWYRDLGDNNGHFWGHVQAIKRPTLLEVTGPLTEVDGGTLIAFRHTALGFIQEEHKQGASKGWAWILEKTRKQAESS